MLRIAAVGLILLLGVFLGLRSCGLSPEQIEDRILLAELNTAEGEAYRQRNQARDGVVTLGSGLQLEILRIGAGPVPEPESMVTVHYRGYHLDGREFDNSYRRGPPSTIPIPSTIPGWRQALTMIPTESRVRLVLPYWLAYGEQGAGHAIGPYETLVFEVELLDSEASQAVGAAAESRQSD